MKEPSSTTHLKRLGLVAFVAILGFLALAYIMSPKSWHYEIAYWHRADALQEMQQIPMVYGGIESVATADRNASCLACHQETVVKFAAAKHKKLSCEDCHGALGDHATKKEKIADAPIHRTRWECLNCHEGLVNKPKRFPTFKTTEKYIKHRELMNGEFPEGTTCLKCHDSHDPTP